jgi:hypothetical protein
MIVRPLPAVSTDGGDPPGAFAAAAHLNDLQGRRPCPGAAWSAFPLQSLRVRDHRSIAPGS